MPQIVPAGYAAVVHSLRLNGDPEPMAITYGVGPFGDAFDAQAVVNSLHAAFGNNLAPRISNAYTLVQTEMTLTVTGSGLSPTDTKAMFVATVPIPCTQENAALPSNSATLVHKRTAAAGRRGRGRLYIPGVPEGEIDANGFFAAAWRSFVQAAVSAFLTEIATAIPGAANGMVLLHQTVPFGQPAPTGGYPLPALVTSLVSDVRIATQRRRLRK